MDGIIAHDNIIYLSYCSEIGGVETFIYELAKKYKNRDIAIVVRQIDKKQLKRLSKLCWVYEFKGQQIICKTAIINYDVTIIPYINKEAKIYQTIHADYEHQFYKNKFPTNDRIYQHIGITKHLVESFKRCTGKQNVILGYNPLTIEKDDYLTLVSATRLTSIKGKDRMIGLANALDRSKIKYIWYVFTNDTDAIKSDNVIYMRPRLDVGRWISQADYVVQLSDTEACSYTINEALYRNIPVIVTPLPYLEEIGYKDGKTGYTLNFDCSNMDDLVSKIQNKPVFKFKHLDDIYGDLFTNKPSEYKEENMKVKVKCTTAYYDILLKRMVEKDEMQIVDNERAEYLVGLGLVEIVERVKEEKKEDKKIPTKKVEKK